MAIEFDIQVRNGTVKITVGGGGQTSSGNATEKGGNPPGGAGGHTGGGGPNESGCCGPMVIGPIVVDSAALQAGAENDGRKGGNPPGGGGGHTGGNPPGGGGGHTGGGGPERGSGSGCCCPVVIGPIVIGGCSGQGATSAGYIGSQAVSIDPPLQDEIKAPTKPFIMQPQEATNWCWAAVAVSVNNFFGSPVGVLADPAWDQFKLANQLLGITSAPGCAQMPVPTKCNQPEGLDVALTITKNLMPDGAKFDQHLTYDSIQKWVAAQLPLGARITWYGGGAHFIALDGVKLMNSGERMVHVQDPSFTSTSPPGLWDYDALVESYLEEGYWSDTYLVMAQTLGVNQVGPEPNAN
jgi:Papain-like cysteine protease AvrRpt2